MKDENIYNTWKEFINDSKYKEYFINNKEQWYDILENVKKYIDENMRKPSRRDKDVNNKQLGAWIGTQINNYNKKCNFKKTNIIKHKYLK